MGARKSVRAYLLAERAVVVGLSLSAAALAAQPRKPAPESDSDRFEMSARLETDMALFRRAPLPGAEGALVVSETALPLQQYVLVQARDVDAPWHKDSLDFELSAWGRGLLLGSYGDGQIDGDVQTAFVRYHGGPWSLRLGRQQAVGGAARFARHDGVSLALALPSGFVSEAYAGLSVLPRYSARPGYYVLGRAEDSLLRDPNAVPEPERSQNWLAGGRFGWSAARGSASVSFHEQRENGELGRRNLGLDTRAELLPEVALFARALLDVDSLRLADASVWTDIEPTKTVSLSLECLHTEPALYLSRQSVLSVFSTDAYDETGGSAEWRVSKRLALQSGAWLELYSRGQAGARAEGSLRVFPGAGRRTLVRLGYSRLLAPDNGYHSLRASLSRRLLSTLTASLEAYEYLYDELVQGRRTSSVYATTLSYQASSALELMWGASVAASPYAALDAQTLVRLSLAFDTPAFESGRP